MVLADTSGLRWTFNTTSTTGGAAASASECAASASAAGGAAASASAAGGAAASASAAGGAAVSASAAGGAAVSASAAGGAAACNAAACDAAAGIGTSLARDDVDFRCTFVAPHAPRALLGSVPAFRLLFNGPSFARLAASNKTLRVDIESKLDSN